MSGQKLSLEALMSASGKGLFVTPAAAPAASRESAATAAAVATTPPVAVSHHTSGHSAPPSRAPYNPIVGRDNDIAAAAAAIAGIGSQQQGHRGPWDHHNHQQGQQASQGNAKKKKKMRGKNKIKGASDESGGAGAGVGAETGAVGHGGQKVAGDHEQAFRQGGGGGGRSGGSGPGNVPAGAAGGSSGHSHGNHHHHQQHHQQHQHHNKKRKQWSKSQQEGDGEGSEQGSDFKRRRGGRRGNEPNRATLSRNEKLALTFYNRDDGQQMARNLDERPDLVGLGTSAGGDDDFDALLTNHMQKTTQEMQQQMEAEVKRLEQFQKEQERLLKANEAKMKREAQKLAAANAAAAAAAAAAATTNTENNTSATPTSPSSGSAAVTPVSTIPTSSQDSPASSTAKPQRKFIPRILCIYWARGRCTNENCTFKHDPSIPQRPASPPPAPKKIDAICKYEKTGSCTRGDACQFSHDLKSIPCYHYYLKGYCQNSTEDCRFSHENATEAQLEELREEWNQKKLMNAPQFQQQQQQQPSQPEMGATLAGLPQGSFGTGSTDTLMAPGLNYGTTAMATTTPFLSGQPEAPVPANYGSALALPPTFQQADALSYSPSADGGEPSL
ncbi:hypothetical protein DFQ27_002341 [Actinomortierella ambigua]|uniref:C3H1-type domain-containing protein n=1 Tax=Actinomortierella ambigua TaxID=1343610 RepID=A0A9P6QAJ9_9FUNG|nr:hypothetical protein DFQ27_002341 [Actinomortierella ambigua]